MLHIGLTLLRKSQLLHRNSGFRIQNDKKTEFNLLTTVFCPPRRTDYSCAKSVISHDSWIGRHIFKTRLKFRWVWIISSASNIIVFSSLLRIIRRRWTHILELKCIRQNLNTESRKYFIINISPFLCFTFYVFINRTRSIFFTRGSLVLSSTYNKC